MGGTRISFAERFAWHISQLRGGRHISNNLQAAANAHGLDALEFQALKAFPACEVKDREREAISRLKPVLNTKGIMREVEYDIVALEKSSGLSQATLRARIKRGLTGEDLVAPPHRAQRREYTRRK